MTDTKHLWEYDHPYYCSEGNYYSNDCHHTFCSWEDFDAEWGDSDLALAALPDVDLGPLRRPLLSGPLSKLMMSCLIAGSSGSLYCHHKSNPSAMKSLVL